MAITLQDVYAKVSKKELNAMMKHLNSLDGGQSGKWNQLSDKQKLTLALEFFPDRFPRPAKPRTALAKKVVMGVAATAALAGALAVLHRYGRQTRDQQELLRDLDASNAALRGYGMPHVRALVAGVGKVDVDTVKKSLRSLPKKAKEQLERLGKFFVANKQGAKRVAAGVSGAAALTGIAALLARYYKHPRETEAELHQLMMRARRMRLTDELRKAGRLVHSVVGSEAAPAEVELVEPIGANWTEYRLEDKPGGGQKIKVARRPRSTTRAPAASYNGFEVDQMEWDPSYDPDALHGQGVSTLFKRLKAKLPGKQTLAKIGKVLGVSIAVVLAAALIYQLATGKIDQAQARERLAEIGRKYGPKVQQAVAATKNVPKEAIQAAAYAYGASKQAAKKAQQQASDYIAEAADEMDSGPGKDNLLSLADLIEPRKPPLGARARAVGRNIRSQARRAHARVSDVFDEVVSV